jgi:Tfp pilus assembly protein PilV
MIEMLVSLTVLIVGMLGIIGLQRTAVQSGAFTRHATEASVLAEDAIEISRLIPAATLQAWATAPVLPCSNALRVPACERIDSQGNTAANGFYVRRYDVTDLGTVYGVSATIRWAERGSANPLTAADTDANLHDIRLTVQRSK